MSGKKAKAARAARPAPAPSLQPTPLGLLTRAERDDYRAILVDGAAATADLEQAEQAYRAAAERHTEERGALFSFARRVATKRGLDVRTIKINPDGRILPAMALVPEPPADAQPVGGSADAIAAAAVAELTLPEGKSA